MRRAQYTRSMLRWLCLIVEVSQQLGISRFSINTATAVVMLRSGNDEESRLAMQRCFTGVQHDKMQKGGY